MHFGVGRVWGGHWPLPNAKCGPQCAPRWSTHARRSEPRAAAAAAAAPCRPPALGVGLRVLGGCRLPGHCILRLHRAPLVSLLAWLAAWLPGWLADDFRGRRKMLPPRRPLHSTAIKHPSGVDVGTLTPINTHGGLLAHPCASTCVCVAPRLPRRDLSTGDAIRVYSGHHKACTTCALNDSAIEGRDDG